MWFATIGKLEAAQKRKREREDRWQAKVAREREELDDEDDERRLRAAQATCTVCGVCGSADPWHWASGCAIEEYHPQSINRRVIEEYHRRVALALL